MFVLPVSAADLFRCNILRVYTSMKCKLTNYKDNLVWASFLCGIWCELLSYVVLYSAGSWYISQEEQVGYELV